MNKYIIKTVLSAAICILSGNTIFAQWSFTGTITGSSSWYCQVEESAVRVMLNDHSGKSYSTKAECDRARDYVIQRAANVSSSCVVYVNCTLCTGGEGSSGGSSEMSNQYQKGLLDVNSGGPQQGSGYFVTNPAQNVQNWSEDYARQQEALGNTSRGLELLQTGNASFDNQYYSEFQQYMVNPSEINTPSSTGRGIRGSNNFDPNAKPKLFDPIEAPTFVKKDAEYYKNQMEESQRKFAECTNDFCRLEAKKEYNQAFDMWIGMSQGKAEQTLADLMQKEFEKQMEAKANVESYYDWETIIDYGNLILSLSTLFIKDNPIGFLATANIELGSEIAKALNNPNEYIDWNTPGVLEAEFWNDGAISTMSNVHSTIFCNKILNNAATEVALSLARGKVAEKWAKAIKIPEKIPIKGFKIPTDKVLDGGNTIFDHATKPAFKGIKSYILDAVNSLFRK